MAEPRVSTVVVEYDEKRQIEWRTTMVVAEYDETRPKQWRATMVMAEVEHGPVVVRRKYGPVIQA